MSEYLIRFFSDPTTPMLIPIYGMRKGKKGQIVAHTLVERSDALKAMKYRWNLDGNGYARNAPNKISLHRHLVNAPADKQVDHENGVKLDNRRGNLRIATSNQNKWNCGKRINNTSGFKGVSWTKHRKKWHAQIWKNNKNFHLGFFDDKIEAAKAYNAAAKRLHGEFARLNEIGVT